MDTTIPLYTLPAFMGYTMFSCYCYRERTNTGSTGLLNSLTSASFGNQALKNHSRGTFTIWEWTVLWLGQEWCTSWSESWK